ncbi:MAG: hypothetical protein IJ109_08210 [Firmicutes bacterium]|nr:hypothetical protein [Bacillota bacterium]
MNKHLKSLLTVTASLVLAFGLAASPAAAASAPEIEDIDYEGKGKVEVEFYGKVKYHETGIKVTDTKGTSYKTKIIEKDSDDITFKIKNYKKGETYRFTIRGIKKRGADSYTSVSGKVKIPKSTKVVVKDIDYDANDREVEFEFKGKVKWKSPTVTITRNGKDYVKKIKHKDSDELEVKVRNLSYGKTYHYTITGVKNSGTGDFKTITGTFKAIDD